MTLQSAAAEAQSPAKRRATAAVRPKGHWTASHWKSLSVLYLGYSTNIFGLTAFDVTNGLRLADASLGLDNAALGKVLSTGAIVYLIGKLINGIVTDALGGRLTSCCSLFASAVGLLSLSFAKTPTMVTIAWSLCRFAQAAAWPGIMASTKQWFAGNGLGTAIGVVSTSSRSGAILGNLLLAPLLRIYSWRTVVRLASGAALFTGTCLRLGLQDAGAPSSPVSSAPSSPKKMVPSHSCAQLSTAAGAVLPVSVLETVKVTLRSPRLLACFCSNALATSVYQFASLLPLMLTQAGSFSSAAAAQAAALYPLGAFGSIFVATSLWDTVLSRPWLRMLYLSGGTAASCVAMAVLPTAAARSPRTAMALLMVVMFGVSPVYYIMTPEHVNTVGGPRSSTLCGWYDAPGYLVTTVFFRTYPALLARGGWHAVCRRLQWFLAGTCACVTAFGLLEMWDKTTEPDPRFVRATRAELPVDEQLEAEEAAAEDAEVEEAAPAESGAEEAVGEKETVAEEADAAPELKPKEAVAEEANAEPEPEPTPGPEPAPEAA